MGGGGGAMCLADSSPEAEGVGVDSGHSEIDKASAPEDEVCDVMAVAESEDPELAAARRNGTDV